MIDGKKVVGVVTEFNPFHEGHAYFLEEIRKQHSADYIVAVMSGDYVQRGEPAFMSKFQRTRGWIFLFSFPSCILFREAGILLTAV